MCEPRERALVGWRLPSGLCLVMVLVDVQSSVSANWSAVESGGRDGCPSRERGLRRREKRKSRQRLWRYGGKRGRR